MSKNKILVIDENPDIRALWGLNLQVFLEANICMAKDNAEAIKLLQDENSNFDLIIVGKNSNNLLSNLGDKSKTNIFYFDQYENNVNVPNFHKFEEKNDIKNLIKKSAEIFDITAQKMISVDVPEQYPIPIEFLTQISKSPARIYKKIGDQFSTVIYPNQDITEQVLSALKKEKIKTVFIDSANRIKFVNNTSLALSSRIQTVVADKSIAPKVKTATLAKGYEIIAKHAEELGIKGATIELTNTCIDAMQSITSESGQLHSMLTSLMENDLSFLYQRSLLTAFIGNHIIQNLKTGSPDQQDKITFVAFFHDIALKDDKYARFYSDEEVDQSGLSSKEKKLIKEHAHIAAELVAKFPKAPFGVEAIIKQHHGSKTGKSLSKLSLNISPLAVVFILAEEWADLALTYKESGKKITKEKVIKYLYNKYNIPAFNKVLPVLHTLNI